MAYQTGSLADLSLCPTPHSLLCSLFVFGCRAASQKTAAKETTRHIPRSKFDVSPDSVHQADLLFLPHDKLRRKVYKYALTVVDVANRYQEAEPLTLKDSAEVPKALQAIYKRSPLTWPQVLQVDHGREFMRGVAKEMENHKTYIRRGRTEIH